MKKIVTSLIVSTLSMSSLYGAYNDPNTDYTNAPSDFSTKVEALEPLKAINQIICLTQHLRPEFMVNKGVYSARIDSKLCSTSKSSDKKTKTDFVIAEVKRESDTSPQIMNLWIPKNNVKARMEVTKEASNADPVGQFNITWQVFEGETSAGKGEIKTVSVDGGKVGYTFFANFGDVKDASSIIKNPDSLEGTAFTKYGDHGKGPETYALAWSNNLVKAQVHNGDVSVISDFTDGEDNKTCQDKSKVNKSVWSYGVYKKDDGSLLDIQTGFPFEGNKDGKIIQGYLSDGGLWIEGDDVEGTSLDVISDIKKINYTDNTKTNITISKVDNKFIAKYDNGTEVTFDKNVELKDGEDNTFTYGGNGSLWNKSSINPIDLKDGITLSDGTSDYVVKALQGVNTLQSTANVNDCEALKLKDPIQLPTSISNNAVFNEDSVPDRPDNVSIVDGELQN